MPVTLEDLEAEMKGAFTDVSIKAAFDVLLKGSLEDLFDGDQSVASHANIMDEGQTVTFTTKDEPPTPPTPPVNPDYPSIHTMAYSASDGYDFVYPQKNVMIRDRVYYYNLTTGIQYEIRVELHRRNAQGWDEGLLTVNGNGIY